jgi:phage-related protein
MAMYGADADALDALGALLEQRAADLDGVYRRLGRQLYAAPWQGQGADQFRGRWNTVHGRHIGDATGFLRTGARLLHDNARQQRAASDSGTGLGAGAGLLAGGGGGGAWGDDAGTDVLDGIGKLLALLGLPASVLAQIKEELKALDPEALAAFEKMLGQHAGLVSFIAKVGKVAGAATTVLGFVKDIAAHPALPMDERLVHAAIETGVGQLESMGSQALATAIITAVTGGMAAPVAFVVGKVIGEVIDKGVSAVDGRFHVTDHIADIGLEAYQYAKTHNFAEMAVDGAVKVVDGAIHGAENLVKDVAHGAENVVSGGANLLKSAWDLL